MTWREEAEEQGRAAAQIAMNNDPEKDDDEDRKPLRITCAPYIGYETDRWGQWNWHEETTNEIREREERGDKR